MKTSIPLRDLRRKIQGTLPPPLSSSTPRSSTSTSNPSSRNETSPELEKPMKTKYVKIITKYWRDGKEVKVIEKKVPADD